MIGIGTDTSALPNTLLGQSTTMNTCCSFGVPIVFARSYVFCREGTVSRPLAPQSAVGEGSMNCSLLAVGRFGNGSTGSRRAGDRPAAMSYVFDSRTVAIPTPFGRDETAPVVSGVVELPRRTALPK